jgi:probable 2-oxoglutarate dehydrogenase E1 component DHKTD1
VLADPSIKNPQDVNQVLLVSGKIYYDLIKERTARNLDGKVAIIRVEELCPFPFATIGNVLREVIHSSDVKVKWVQEEHQNQGAWPHVMPRLPSVFEGIDMGGKSVTFVGRPPSEVPAVGVGKLHAAQLSDIMNRSFD